MNFLYDFNSFIETNDYGGHIIIVGTTFERFSTCGAIVRNFRTPFTYYKGMESTSSASEVYDYRHNTIQEEIYAEERARSAFVESPFKETCSSTGANKCFSLMIDGSTFSYFNFEMKA
jgi:hypothetical protein